MNTSSLFTDTSFITGGATGAGAVTGTGAATLSSSFDKFLGGAGLVLAFTGMVNSAIGSYFGSQSEALKLKSQAMSYDYQAKMSELNASMLESQAWHIMQDGQRASAMATLRAGQTKSSARAMMGSRGVVLGVGSTAEVQASNELMKDVERLAINASTVRAREATRMKKVGMDSAASLQRVSGFNLENSSRGIDKMGAVGNSLLSSANTLITSMHDRRKYDFLLGKKGK